MLVLSDGYISGGMGACLELLVKLASLKLRLARESAFFCEEVGCVVESLHMPMPPKNLAHLQLQGWFTARSADITPRF